MRKSHEWHAGCRSVLAALSGDFNNLRIMWNFLNRHTQWKGHVLIRMLWTAETMLGMSVNLDPWWFSCVCICVCDFAFANRCMGGVLCIHNSGSIRAFMQSSSISGSVWSHSSRPAGHNSSSLHDIPSSCSHWHFFAKKWNYGMTKMFVETLGCNICCIHHMSCYYQKHS